MKLAFVYDAVYPWVKGGAEKRIFELGRRLVQKGHEVHVFGIKWWDGADVITNKGMVLHGVCKKTELYVHGRRSISEAIIFSIELIPHLYKEKFDLIDVSVFPYFSCFSAKLVSVLTRTPLIFTWHEVWGDYWYEYLGKNGFFGKNVEMMVSKLSHECIVVSEMTKVSLRSLGSGCMNVDLVPNGIDFEKISSITPSDLKCDIIFTGRLIKEKNVDLLIDAIVHVMKFMPDIKCHIVGGGPEEKRLVGLVFSYGLQNNVTFFGFIEHDEVIAKIKSSKVMALPSRREGFGMVVIEAFGCGIPVVTIRHHQNASCELVNEGTGIIADPDAKELAKTLVRLCNDERLREVMAANAMEKAKEYDWDKIVEKLICIYGRIVKIREINNRT